MLVSLPAAGQFNADLYLSYNRAIEKGDFKKAKKELVEISKIEKNTFMKLLITGEYFGIQGHLDSANHYLTEAISYFKYQPISYSDGNFLLKKDSLYRVAIGIFDEIIKAEPNGINYCNRGIFKSDIGLHRQALRDYQLAIKIDTAHYLNFYNQALAYRGLNILDSAIISYNNSIRCNPGYGSAYLNKGFIYIKLDSFQLAIEQFQSSLMVLKSTKERSFSLNNIGYCYYKLGEYELAQKIVSESLKINPTNSYAYRNKALIDIQLDDNVSACSAINSAIELGFVNEYGNEILELKEENCK